MMLLIMLRPGPVLGFRVQTTLKERHRHRHRHRAYRTARARAVASAPTATASRAARENDCAPSPCT